MLHIYSEMNGRKGVIMKRKGFTLLELMIVIVVAGIITAIAIPSFNAMYKRNRIYNAKATILNTILLAKSNVATSLVDWQVIFTGPNTIAVGPVGGSPIETKNFPTGVEYANAGLSLIFTFSRDGTASGAPQDSFAIKNDKGQVISFVLIPQIGEVKTIP